MDARFSGCYFIRVSYLFLIFKLMYCFDELFAETDGVALRAEYYAIECVGYDEYREWGIGKFHFANDLLLDWTIGVDAEVEIGELWVEGRD